MSSKERKTTVEELKGQILKAIYHNTENIYFVTEEDKIYKMFHEQDCCETVQIEDICGNFYDLIGSPIILAEEVVSDNFELQNYCDQPHLFKNSVTSDFSVTWTFYKFATVKGYVDIRWHGTSNGYYSEGVDFYQVEQLHEDIESFETFKARSIDLTDKITQKEVKLGLSYSMGYKKILENVFNSIRAQQEEKITELEETLKAASEITADIHKRLNEQGRMNAQYRGEIKEKDDKINKLQKDIRVIKDAHLECIIENDKLKIENEKLRYRLKAYPFVKDELLKTRQENKSLNQTVYDLKQSIETKQDYREWDGDCEGED